MRGKRKLAPVLRTKGFTVSKAMAGRILGVLIERGIVVKARGLIREAAVRKAPKKRPHAIRKPGGVTFEKPECS
jgi:hypothetical protein